MDRTVPVKGFTPLDLLKHAEMIAAAIARPGLDTHDVVLLKATILGRPCAEVVVHLVGRPPLCITVAEVP